MQFPMTYNESNTAILQVESAPVAVESANDVMFELMEAGFQESHPDLYQLIESFRNLFGISKEKMREFSMKALETFSEMEELWEKLKDMFTKNEKLQGAINADHKNMIPRNKRQNYRSY
ncbi:hypothetical protein PV327_002618 [Microctonus hyperodae]|uniref:Uncharacterized protein n=1 Tax=Microctonus hyperodae TaxID=165561 RepID=A0AA39FG43_MICHY|nr:hypothetical protein PV327_002618 [Microctonus hyperodae]